MQGDRAFTQEEWDILACAPRSVEVAVRVSHLHTSLQDALRAFHTWDATQVLFPDSELVQAIIRDQRQDEDLARVGVAVETHTSAGLQRHIHDHALALCYEAAAILKHKATVQERDDYWRFVHSVATAAACDNQQTELSPWCGRSLHELERTAIAQIEGALAH